MTDIFDLPTLKIVDANKTEAVDVDIRFVDAIRNADDAFWAVIAESYPEITSGDLAPEIVMELQMVMETSVAQWLKSNAPQGTSLKSLVHSRRPPNFQ